MWSTKANGRVESSSDDTSHDELYRVRGELDATKFEMSMRDEELTRLNQRHAEEVAESNRTRDKLTDRIAKLEEDLVLAEKSGARDSRFNRDLKTQVDSHTARIKQLEGQLATMCVQMEFAETARKESQAAYEANLVMTARLKHDLDEERAMNHEHGRRLSETTRRLDARGHLIQQLEQRISNMKNNGGKRELVDMNSSRDPKRLRHW